MLRRQGKRCEIDGLTLASLEWDDGMIEGGGV